MYHKVLFMVDKVIGTFVLDSADPMNKTMRLTYVFSKSCVYVMFDVPVQQSKLLVIVTNTSSLLLLSIAIR